jgi:hypothetical protein
MKKVKNQRGKSYQRFSQHAVEQRKAMAKARSSGTFNGQKHLSESPAGRAIATGVFDHLAY